MNRFKLANTILKRFDNIIWICIILYIQWVLLSPGYYWYSIILWLVIVGYFWIAKKLRKFLENSNKKYTHEELVEDRYAMSYRKRYYSTVYLTVLVVMFIVSGTVLGYYVYKQFDTEINTKYTNCIEEAFNEYMPNIDDTVYRKLCIVIPNPGKECLVASVDTIRLANELSAELITYVDAGSVDEERLKYWEGVVAETKERVDELSHKLILFIYVVGISAIIFKLTYEELESYTHHRSIEL